MNYILIYDGAIKANKVGAFIKCGEGFDIIRPGYDSQGRRRQQWTQIIHQGVPVYTQKVMIPIPDVLTKFDGLWDHWIGTDLGLMTRAMAATKKQHLDRFKDGKTGETPAPSLTVDGREQGQIYPS